MAGADVVDQVIADSAGDCKKARRLLKEKYRNRICVKLALRTGLTFFLDSGLHVADAATEAPAARDADDAAPLVTAEGRWAATWAEAPDAARVSAT
jgi:hypothetical protein